MDTLNRVLQYIKKTNPDIDMQRLVYELEQCDYTAESMVFMAHQMMNEMP